MEDSRVEVGAIICIPCTVPQCSCCTALWQTQVPWGAACLPASQCSGVPDHGDQEAGQGDGEQVLVSAPQVADLASNIPMPDDVDIVTLMSSFSPILYYNAAAFFWEGKSLSVMATVTRK